ncbi:hypothetical protein Hanom_Chr13g01244811 [Helianthus anomalus]
MKRAIANAIIAIDNSGLSKWKWFFINYELTSINLLSTGQLDKRRRSVVSYVDRPFKYKVVRQLNSVNGRSWKRAQSLRYNSVS